MFSIKKPSHGRKCYVTLLLLFTMTFSNALSAFAQTSAVLIDGTPVPFTKESGSPFTDQQGRMQVPLRSTMEAFGCTVTWDGSKQEATVTKEDVTVQVPLGTRYLFVNGVKKPTDTSALMEQGRVYLPIRPVLESFGADLAWNAPENTLSITTFSTPAPQPPRPTSSIKADLSVHFIDVGQGDAIFIDYGTYEILVDGGNNKDGEAVVAYLKDYVDGPLELMIGTHPDADHIGGLDNVLLAYDVEKVIDSGEKKETKTYVDYWNAVTGEPNCQILYDENQTFDLGNGATLEIIETGDDYKDSNDNSVVALLTYGEVSLLLTGDMEKEAEAAAVSNLSPVTILKAPHHGSATSSAEEMLKITKPQYVVISAGQKNSYKHPHQVVLDRYAAIGATVYGTFRSGTIIMGTDGTNVSFNTNTIVQLSDAGDYKKTA